MVTVSLAAAGLSRIDTLAALGLGGSLRVLALVGVGETAVLLRATVVVRRFVRRPRDAVADEIVALLVSEYNRALDESSLNPRNHGPDAQRTVVRPGGC
jgi:hypothetical protein